MMQDSNHSNDTKKKEKNPPKLFLWWLRFFLSLICFLPKWWVVWGRLNIHCRGVFFNYVLLLQWLCNKFHGVLWSFEGFILIKPAWAQGLESALTYLITRTNYDEIMRAQHFMVISPVGCLSYKAVDEKTSSDTVLLKPVGTKFKTIVVLHDDHPNPSQKTAKALSPGRGIFITFIPCACCHSNMANIWSLLIPFLPLWEQTLEKVMQKCEMLSWARSVWGLRMTES